MHKSLFFLVACFLTLVNDALCLEDYSFDLEADILEKNRSLSKDLVVFADSSGTLDIHELLSHRGTEGFSKDYNLSKNQVYWGKIKLQNIDKKVNRYYLYIGRNDFIDAYYVHKGEVIDYAKSGYLYPANDKKVRKGSYYIPVDLGPESSLDIYIRIEERLHQSPDFSLQLYSPDQWHQKIINKQFSDLIFQCIFWIIMIYNLFLYFTSKIKSSLHYASYLFFVSLTYLFLSNILREIILAPVPELTPYFMSAIPLAVFFYWRFIFDFLSLKEYRLRLFQNMQVLVYANGAIGLLIIPYLLITGDLYLPVHVTRYLILLNIAVVLALLIRLRKSDIPLLKFVVLGTSLLISFCIVEVIAWDPDTSSAFLVRYGLLFEIIVFSIGLHQKIKLSERQQKAVLNKEIEQLTVKETLSDWQKEELEKIIDNRTESLDKRNKELHEAILKAEKATKIKSDFLSVMSHEIRTPMNAVIGLIHLLLADNPKSTQMDNLKTLKFSAENLLILINDILDFSKVEAGKIHLEHIPFDLKELTKTIGTSHEIKASSKEVEFNILLDHNIPSTLKGDPARLTQILHNLIDNAIKFTHKGSVRLLIHVKENFADRCKIQFVVEDTGIGISEKDKQLIFDSFTQAHDYTSRKFGGTGLGLAITKKLLNLYGSEILVESQVNKGSKFHFTLSLEKVKHSTTPSDLDPKGITPLLSQKKVLIVDDNEINLLMAQQFVKTWGMQNHIVRSGPEALSAIFNDDFDIILLDIQMPEMDGYEVAKTIRSLEINSLKNIPIIAISADTYENVHERLKESRIDNFIAKPFNPQDLLSMMGSYLITKINNA